MPERLPELLSDDLTNLPQETVGPPQQSEVHRFLDLVICDGRYIGELAKNPRLVANELGFPLSVEAEAELQSKPFEQHVVELCSTRFVTQGEVIAIIVVVAVVVTIVGVRKYLENKKPKTAVNDFSPRARLKM